MKGTIEDWLHLLRREKRGKQAVGLKDKSKCGLIGKSTHEPLALDSRLVRKISKRHFFQDITNSFHGVTQIGLEPHQNFFQNFFSTNMVARGV